MRGDWTPTPGIGWQHDDLPKPPPKLLAASRAAWSTWLGSWFAAHWLPADLPMLRQVIRLYDKVERGDATGSERTELRQLADSFGITHKGQQDRRWQPPKAAAAPIATPSPDQPPASRYGHLRAVG